MLLIYQETKEHDLMSFQLHHNWPRPLPMCLVSRATLMEEWRRWPEGRKQRTLSVDRFTRLQLPTEPFLIAVGRYKSHGQEWELYLQTEPRIFQWSLCVYVSLVLGWFVVVWGAVFRSSSFRVSPSEMTCNTIGARTHISIWISFMFLYIVYCVVKYLLFFVLDASYWPRQTCQGCQIIMRHKAPPCLSVVGRQGGV